MFDEHAAKKSSRETGPADPEKRDTLRKLAAGAAFAAPVVLSFSLNGLAITDARAYVGASDGVEPLPARESVTGGTDPGSTPAGSATERPAGKEFGDR